MHRESGEKHAVEDGRRHEPPECPARQHPSRAARRWSRRYGRLDIVRPPLAGNDDGVDAGADGDVEPGEHCQGHTPAERFDQEMRHRQEHGAGQSADQGHGRDGAPRARADRAREHGEAGLVERGAHGEAEADPHGQERRIAFDPRPGQQEDGRQDGPARHDDATVAEVDEAADRQGAGTRCRKADRIGRGELGLRPAELTRHRIHEQREGVEDRSPGDELGKGQGPDECPGQRVRR